MKTGWKVIGDDAERRIAELKATDENKNLLSYEQAKRIALEELRDEVRPYLKRIEELERDVFQTTGALPPLKAWVRWTRNTLVVTAKSKVRARELLQLSRNRFDDDWSECDGDWWYHLAHNESIWVEERDANGRNTGKFYQSLSQDEVAAILDAHAAPYHTMRITRLLDMVGEDRIESGASTAGTPYKITTSVRQYSWDNSTIHVDCEIDDGCHVLHRPTRYVTRELPQVEVVTAAEWKSQGF